MKCHDMLGNISKYIDGELEAELCAALEQHMKECPDCDIVVDTLNRTVTLYKEHGHTPLPDDVKERLLAALALATENGG